MALTVERAQLPCMQGTNCATKANNALGWNRTINLSITNGFNHHIIPVIILYIVIFIKYISYFYFFSLMVFETIKYLFFILKIISGTNK
jgi:hypothetical protein